MIADLSGSELAELRRPAETFFRHFRRPEMYARWEREGAT